jgi:predicted phage replisome organizer
MDLLSARGVMKMAEVKWIKLSTNMFEDEKIRLIESLPEADTILIIWVKLLAQAGKTNASGYIYLSERIPFTDEMLATIFNRPIGTVRLALKTFEQFGMIEINDDHFISIANWEKHQNIDGLEKIRQQTKKRVADHRQKKREMLLEQNCNVTVTRGNATDIEEDIDKEIDKEKEISNSNENQFPEIMNFYSNNLQKGISETPFNLELIQLWFDEFGFDLLLAAMKVSAKAEVKGVKFVEGVLKNWKEAGVKTIDDARKHEQAFKQKPKGGYSRKPIRVEADPDEIFAKQKEQQKKQTPAELAAKQREIDEMLKALNEGVN